MNIKVGRSIRILNNAGLLDVHVDSEVRLNDIMIGVGKDALPSMDAPRLEIHKNDTGKILITIMDRHKTIPFDMWLIEIDPMCMSRDCTKVYKGHVSNGEIKMEDYTTI